MTAAAPIEDFLEAITAQLDKTQDSLRLKAVNRPLTFALKDFNIDLSVFVEMDADGQVRLRPSGPNESGASIIKVGFTTITRPMIEENTISMELTQSPSLVDAGFALDESKQLERLGVRNIAQLERLRSSTDEDAIAQFSRIDAGTLRQRLRRAQPRIERVQIGPRDTPLQRPSARADEPAPIQLRPGQSRLRLRGQRLAESGSEPSARLEGRSLPIRAFSQTHIELDLPEHAGGRLDIELPHGGVESFELVTEDDSSDVQRGAESWSDPDSPAYRSPAGDET